MNASKTILRLLVISQMFTLFFLMLLPTLTHFLAEPWGKLIYGICIFCAAGLALALRYTLKTLE